MWIKRLLEDFDAGQIKAITLYEDNQSAIMMMKSNEFRSKTKHIDTKYHFVTDLVKKNVISLKYCPTEEMIADMLTKLLGAVKLRGHRERCQLMEKIIVEGGCWKNPNGYNDSHGLCTYAAGTPHTHPSSLF